MSDDGSTKFIFSIEQQPLNAHDSISVTDEGISISFSDLQSLNAFHFIDNSEDFLSKTILERDKQFLKLSFSIIFTDDETVKIFNEVQFWKELLWISVTEDGIEISTKDLQFKKQHSWIVSNEEGLSNVISFKDVQFENDFFSIFFTEEGILKDSKEAQFWNELSQIVFNDEGWLNVICVIFKQSLNAFFLIEVTEDGIVICFNDLHSSNKYSSITFIVVDEMLICSNELHPLKAPHQMYFTDDGILMFVNDEQYLNALTLMNFTADGIVTRCSLAHFWNVNDGISEIDDGIDKVVNFLHPSKHPGKSSFSEWFKRKFIISILFFDAAFLNAVMFKKKYLEYH